MFKKTKPTTNAAMAARFAEICEHIMEQGGNFNISPRDMERDVNSMSYTCTTYTPHRTSHFHVFARAFSYNEPQVYLAHNRFNQQWEIWFNENTTRTNTTARHMGHYMTAIQKMRVRYPDTKVYKVSLGSWTPNFEYDRVGHSNVSNMRYMVKEAMRDLTNLGEKHVRQITMERVIDNNSCKLVNIRTRLTSGVNTGMLESPHVHEMWTETVRECEESLAMYRQLREILGDCGLQAAKRHVQAVAALEG